MTDDGLTKAFGKKYWCVKRSLKDLCLFKVFKVCFYLFLSVSNLMIFFQKDPQVFWLSHGSVLQFTEIFHLTKGHRRGRKRSWFW